MKKKIKQQGKAPFLRHAVEVCLYRKELESGPLKLVSMDMEEHGSFMHSWANQYYASKYWQMEGDFEAFHAYYTAKLKNNEELLLIACLNDIPIAQLEIYPVLSSVLAGHYTASVKDYGIHILMAPYRTLLEKLGDRAKGLSTTVLQSTLEYLFYIAGAENVLAEPDKANKNACLLAQRVGFTFLKEITLPDKTAHLFRYRRGAFLKKCPKLPKDKTFNLFADNFKP